VRRAIALSLCLLALAAAGCGGDDEPEATATATETSSDASGECREVDAPEPREPGTLEPPSSPLAGTSYSLRFETSCGTFTVALQTDLAPKTSASLVALAEQGYFDGTIFHRIVPGFVIQGGDPTQTGGGGPGYTTVDPIVAMAKTPEEAPGASGSQFFVVTADDAMLPPDYAIVGTVEGTGLDVVERIGELGDASEQPTQTVLVEKVTVVEG
jgi:cyclophilin family peptidyl-prolyl cis-trans isomerase